MKGKAKNFLACCLAGLLLMYASGCSTQAQTRSRSQRKKSAASKPASELQTLREEFVKATREYKASLTRLLAIYERNVLKAEKVAEQSKALFAEGLIAKTKMEESEAELASAQDKVVQTKQQLDTAETQIASTLLEADAEAKLGKTVIRRGTVVQTASYIRYGGSGSWNLSEAWKVQRFFQDMFKRPLPIAVFGQGAIHERWRLDHRNSMDLSINPGSPEGQALIQFLRENGIPFLAFRSAIPGTSTGPHIHVGHPSRRY